MKKFIVSAITLLFFVLHSHAQDVTTATIQWTSTATMDLKLGDTRDEVTTLTTYGSERIEWKNPDGSMRQSFQVIEVMGAWTNPTTEGRVQYQVTDMTHSGTIVIHKEGQTTKAIISLATGTGQVTELSLQSFLLP